MSVSPLDGFLLESHPILLCVTSTIPDVHTQDLSFANETTRLNEVPRTNKLQIQVLNSHLLTAATVAPAPGSVMPSLSGR